MCALRTRAREDVSCSVVVVRNYGAASAVQRAVLCSGVLCSGVRLPGILTPLPLPSIQQPFLGSILESQKSARSPLFRTLNSFQAHRVSLRFF